MANFEAYSYSTSKKVPIFYDAQHTQTDHVDDAPNVTFISTYVPYTYNGNIEPKTTYYFYGNLDMDYKFTENGQFLTEVSSDKPGYHKYEMTVVFVSLSNPLTCTNGSLDITINGFDNTPLETFKVIPGQLDTTILANGDYADISIPIIFEKMKKYAFTESIFTSIQCTLAAFFVSIALEQRITERIESLVQQLSAGEINIDQFNELVQQGTEEFASEYGKNYVSNYVKLQQAIDKFKYIVEKSIIKE